MAVHNRLGAALDWSQRYQAALDHELQQDQCRTSAVIVAQRRANLSVCNGLAAAFDNTHYVNCRPASDAAQESPHAAQVLDWLVPLRPGDSGTTGRAARQAVAATVRSGMGLDQATRGSPLCVATPKPLAPPRNFAGSARPRLRP